IPPGVAEPFPQPDSSLAEGNGKGGENSCSWYYLSSSLVPWLQEAELQPLKLKKQIIPQPAMDYVIAILLFSICYGHKGIATSHSVQLQFSCN
ncbi:MAG: hypothetical protein Q7V48_09965, partial [Deltaproteobacteria bacterium]|nr:hypothetical protein [Deltaproteobacteria bacterium]